MIRKTAIATIAVSALALGTASATSLGTFNDATFAASDVDLLNCDLGTDIDLLSLLPALPAVDDVIVDPVGITTFALDSLDLSALETLLDALDVECLTGTVLDVVLLASDGTVLDVLEIDPDGVGVDLADVSLNEVLDVTVVSSVRMVLRDA